MAHLWDWKRSKVAEAQGRLNWSSVGLNERAAGQAIRAPKYQAKPSLKDDYVTEWILLFSSEHCSKGQRVNTLDFVVHVLSRSLFYDPLEM